VYFINRKGNESTLMYATHNVHYSRFLAPHICVFDSNTEKQKLWKLNEKKPTILWSIDRWLLDAARKYCRKLHRSFLQYFLSALSSHLSLYLYYSFIQVSSFQRLYFTP